MMATFFRGISPAEADMNLLETARRCELYGAKLHAAQVYSLFLSLYLSHSLCFVCKLHAAEVYSELSLSLSASLQINI